MSDNTALWDKLGKTDPSHTKQFKRSGGFSGTAIKPMWSYRRMTEEFGPCGKGWGICKPSFDVVPAGESVMVYCTVSVWYEKQDQAVFGVGGDMIAGKRGNYFMVDDEAFKKAYTDAVTNALKMIGVGADVHMGMFDDNKYVNTLQREFAEEKHEPAKEQKAPKPASAGADKPASSAEQKRQLAEIDTDLLDCHTEVDVKRCADIWQSIATRDQWSRDYKMLAKEKFDAKRRQIAEENDFPGDFPGSNDDVRNHVLNAG